MIKLYAIIIVVALLGGMGYGAKYYYDNTQERIRILTENNAQLESAVAVQEASIDSLKDNIEKFQELNNQLQQDLQKAEQYGDDLRNKLRQIDLVQDAFKDALELQGKMNGATAKLWREIERDTGGDPDPTLPEWLQYDAEGAGDQSGDESGTSTDSTSDSSQTSGSD